MLNKEIIPISYMSGTGGNFLCHFIITAKRNDKRVVELSEHGNCHINGNKDIDSPPGGIHQPVSEIDKINYILNQQASPVSQKPYITAGHILDLRLISEYFEKSIRITYDQDDISDLSKVTFGKFYIDYNPNKNSSDTPDLYLGVLYDALSLFQKENIEGVLFISWKELFLGNVEDLISKISTFTDIDASNFSKESLIHWRDKTQYCIDKFTN